MKGARPLTDDEVQAVLAALPGPRERALFVLGVRSGFRIAELLSLRVEDVWQFGRIADTITVHRRNMKKKRASRTVPLHREAREAISEWLGVMAPRDQSWFLFKSRKGQNRPITPISAWRILDAAYIKAGITGPTGTHVMRKTFAARMFKKFGRDLIKLKEAMGHASVVSTQSYIGFDQGEIDAAILE